MEGLPFTNNGDSEGSEYENDEILEINAMGEMMVIDVEKLSFVAMFSEERQVAAAALNALAGVRKALPPEPHTKRTRNQPNTGKTA